jgi:glycosyltransferase involved in cell wall biosynthesis
LNILLLSDHFPPEAFGGASRMVFIQAQALARLGHRVRVLSTRQHADAPAEVEIEGIPVYRLHVDYPLRWRAYLSLYNPLVAPGLRRAIEDFGPDIVHAHNVHTYLTYHSFTLANRMGLPAVLTAHDVMTVAYQKFDSFIDPKDPARCEELDYRVRPGSQIRRQRFRYFPWRNDIIRRIIARRVDVIVSPSEMLIHVLQINGVHARRMVAIANGIDPTRFDSSPEDQQAFRARHDLVGRKIVLLAGRINRLKGADQMLEALPRIVRRVPQAVLLILARPEGYPRVMQHIAESHGLGQHIRPVGWLTDRALAAAFGAAEVCAVPSVCFENLPTAALEAQAAGTPVVVTCFGGAPETILDGQTGFVVNPFDIAALTDRIVTLLKDDKLNAQMSKRARGHARQNFDWLQQARKLEALYQETLDAQAGGGSRGVSCPDAARRPAPTTMRPTSMY